MKNIRSAEKQKGAVLALFVISLVAIIALGGLALDVSHAYIDKTRLQNVLDATALSGAMTLGINGNTATAEVLASQDAIATFDADLEAELAAASLTPTIEFSRTLDPFVPGSTPAQFVRASLHSYNMPTWLARVIGKDTLRVGGSAVAGPIASATCNLAPFVVCGNPDLPCEDPDNCYGFEVWEEGDTGTPEECYLKGCAQADGDCNTDQITGDQCGVQEGSATGGGQTSDVGTGSFYLIELECGTGGDCVRDSFASGVENCPTDEVNTEPGMKTGPLAQGFNTVFNDYSGPVDPELFPPDQVIDTTSDDIPGRDRVFYDEYMGRSEGQTGFSPVDIPAPDGVRNRRLKSVIIADCSEKVNGRHVLDVLTVGCFFLTQPTEQQGNAQVVWGQFIGECPGNGRISLVTNPVFTQQKIILYKDPDSTDS
jgi:hypothetical protein